MLIDLDDAIDRRDRGGAAPEAPTPIPTGPPPDPMDGDVAGLTVYADEACGFCGWCRGWLSAQSLLVPMRFAPAGGEEAQRRLGPLADGTLDDLVVQADDGRVWVGPSAFVLCLWATEHHRDLAMRLRIPGFKLTAERFFHMISANRKTLARFVPPASLVRR